MILHLGVLDIGYAENANVDPRFYKYGTETTGNVAEKLEWDYGVMQGFVDMYETAIAQFLENSVSTGIDSILAGVSYDIHIFNDGLFEIEELFKKQYLSLDQTAWAGLGPGQVPTKAALMGMSKRKKLLTGPPRPSFIDSGLYEASFKVWME